MISILAPARAAASHACQSRARFSRRSAGFDLAPRRREPGGIGPLAAEELHHVEPAGTFDGRAHAARRGSVSATGPSTWPSARSPSGSARENGPTSL